MLEQLETKTDIGGRGCENCLHWKEYGSMTLELYGFVGKWGRCYNEKTAEELNRKYLTQRTTPKDRTQTHINRLSLESMIISTTPTYSCPNMRIPLDKKEDSGNDGKV